MPRSLLSCVLVCVSSFAFAQGSRAQIHSGAGSSPAVQIVYVMRGANLTTYNINPQTLEATAVGSLTVPQSTVPGVVMSPNGHFLYFMAAKDISNQGRMIYVYATNDSGVPQNPPVQEFSVANLYSGPVFSGNFAYEIFEGTPGPEYTSFAIKRYVFDSSTGMLSSPQIEAEYELTDGTEGCYPNLIGPNASGSELYDYIYCFNPEGTSARYNQRAIDAQTGALGPDVEIYAWATDFPAGVGVQLANGFLFAFNKPGDDEPNSSIKVYPIQPNSKTPVATCTAAQMLSCGDFVFGLAHPSGQYVFLTDSSNTTDVGAVDLSTETIRGPVSSIPYEVQQFSPDGSLVYGVNDVGNAMDLEIYGFDASNGSVTQGGTISVPSVLDSWWPEERN